jgi:biotin synthase-like enzyme
MPESFEETILKNNASHHVDDTELAVLIKEANKIFKANHKNEVWFERSVFINWTCAIADCKYCYLSTKPKNDKQALRSPESILAEMIFCKAMGYTIGYITGGLRVEPNEYMKNLLTNAEKVIGYKVRMNFGPYMKSEIEAFGPLTAGIGSAVESFDESLHNYICPSKPLKSLMSMLKICKEKEIPTFITIILGMGEKQSDIEEVITKVKELHISMVQLCFLKPQENTVFSDVPPPDTKYMAWWTAKLRIACPAIIIKIALVEERVHEISVLLEAGANCFSRFMIFKEFGTKFTDAIISESKKANRTLIGEFNEVPELDCTELVDKTSLDAEMKAKVLPKLEQYYENLQKGLFKRKNT